MAEREKKKDKKKSRREMRVTLASLGCHGGLITKPHLVTYPAEGFLPPCLLPPPTSAPAVGSYCFRS